MTSTFKTSFKVAALVLSLSAAVASAQAVRTEKNMSLELANQIASATLAACSTAGGGVGCFCNVHGPVSRRCGASPIATAHRQGFEQETGIEGCADQSGRHASWCGAFCVAGHRSRRKGTSRGHRYCFHFGGRLSN